MDMSDLAVLCSDFGSTCIDDYLVTFHAASRSGKDDDPPPYTYCLESGYAAEIKALHLQKVIEDWEGIRERVKRGERAPFNVDSLYLKNGIYYLVEFKDNQKASLKKLRKSLYNKARDAIHILVRHGVKSAEYFRADSIYIVVATKIKNKTDVELGLAASAGLLYEDDLFDEMFGPPDDIIAKPWKAPEYEADADLGCWNGLLYRQVLTLTPTQFNNYAEEGQWR